MKQSGLGRYSITPDKENPIFSRFNINSSLMPGIGQCELIAHSYKLAYGRVANVMDNLTFQKNWQENDCFDIVFQQTNKQFFVIPSGERGAQSFFSGNVDTKDLPTQKRLDINQLKGKLQNQFAHSQVYGYFENAGIDYGQFYRNINKVYSNTEEVLAEIVLSDENKRTITSNLHPGILDSAVQAFIGCHLANANSAKTNCVFSPLKIDQILMYQALKDDQYYSHVKRLMDKNDDLIHCDIDICNTDGDIIIEIKNFTAQRIELFERETLPDNSDQSSSLSIKDYLIYCIADILNIGHSDVDFYAQFMDMNADSVSAVKLVTMLEEGLGIELYPTLLFEYSSVDSLFDYLITQVDENKRVQLSQTPTQSVDEEQETDGDVSSLSCRALGCQSVELDKVEEEKTVLDTQSESAPMSKSSLTVLVFDQISSLQKNIELQRVEHNAMIDKQMESIRLLVELAKSGGNVDAHLNDDLSNSPVASNEVVDDTSNAAVDTSVSISVTDLSTEGIKYQSDIENYVLQLCLEKFDPQKAIQNSVAIDLQTSFLEMGADSIVALKVVKEVESKLGLELYPTLLFEYQNIAELSEYLFQEIEQKSA